MMIYDKYNCKNNYKCFFCKQIQFNFAIKYSFFFKKLTNYLMILVTIEIHHAICEYEKNYKITLKFEEMIVKSIYINFL